MRDHLQSLSHVGVGGRLIRIHGDYHLGQTVCGRRGLGGPRLRGRAGPAAARAPPQALAAARRGRHAALVRLRSLGGVLLRGAAGAGGLGAGGPRALPRRLHGEVDPAMLPAGGPAVDQAAGDLRARERAIYELRYELDNRPDWVAIPVAVHRRACSGRRRRDRPSATRMAVVPLSRSEVRQIVARDHPDPHRVLGAHAARTGVRVTRLPARRRGGLGARRRGAAIQLQRLRADRRAASSSGVLRAPSCRCATSSRCATRTAASVRAARPLRLPADARRARPPPRRRGAPRASSTSGSAPTPASSTASAEPRSRSGRRRRARSASSATSTAGTGACTRCARSAHPACGSCSCPASARARATSTRSARRAASCA